MASYQPPVTINAKILDLVAQFNELLGRWVVESKIALTPKLRRENRIRTIQASLAIEQNTLSVDQVSAVIDGKPVMGPPREIQEVKNAFTVYEQLSNWLPHSEHHLLEAHQNLMKGLVEEIGSYRSGGVGIYQKEKLVHMAPPANQVPRLMGNLLTWLQQTDLHPLVSSCVFHYEFEFIHPFSDGNGRMGRLWQTLILSKWREELAWLPVETVVHNRQKGYYQALGLADQAAESTVFVEFMLEALLHALQQAIMQNDGVSEEVNDGVNVKLDELDQQLLQFIGKQPYITQEELVRLTNKSLSTIQRRIRKLRKHHIKRKGADKDGYWQLLK